MVKKALVVDRETQNYRVQTEGSRFILSSYPFPDMCLDLIGLLLIFKDLWYVYRARPRNSAEPVDFWSLRYVERRSRKMRLLHVEKELRSDQFQYRPINLVHMTRIGLPIIQDRSDWIESTCRSPEHRKPVSIEHPREVAIDTDTDK